MQIYKAINEWLLNYTPLNNWIYFNATPVITGTVAMNMVAGDRVTKEYIDGTLRFSFDLCNTIKEIDIVCNEIERIISLLSK